MYADGGSFCFACTKPGKKYKFISGAVQELTSRCLKEDSCRKYQLEVGYYTGSMTIDGTKTKVENHPVRIYNYFANGAKIAQKLKDKDKNMTIIGQTKGLGLYGEWLFNPSDKVPIVITEGEDDAVAVCEAFGLVFPVVSIPYGVSSAKSVILRRLQWLMGWKHIVLWFDNDEYGQRAIEDVANLFDPGKVKVVHCPDYKDANDILKDKSIDYDVRCSRIKNAIWNAKVIGGESIVTISDIIDEIMEQPQFGDPYPWEPMTDITYGFQLGEMHIVVAATGIGKTEFIFKMILPFLDKYNIGVFSFEQKAANTARRIVGNELGLKLHIPGGEWPAEKIRNTAMKYDNKIFFHARPGFCELDDLIRAIRYQAKAFDCKIFIIDNLKALRLHDKERAEHFMNVIQALKLDLGISIYILSHVVKDKIARQAYVSTSPKNPEAYADMGVEDLEGLINKDGLEWESGRMPAIENIDGHNVVSALSDYVWALARNTTSKDEHEKKILRVKPLKTRLDSSKTGKIFKLRYDTDGSYTVVANKQTFSYSQDASDEVF